MTPVQQSILDAVRRINATDEFTGWFDPAEVMAFCQVESNFRTRAYRYEPALNEASYGLMQVLASTAREVDPALDDPTKMYAVEVGLRIGMLVARKYYLRLEADLGHEPSLEEWAASYNEGVGGAESAIRRGLDPDLHYANVWMAAYDSWNKELGTSDAK